MPSERGQDSARATEPSAWRGRQLRVAAMLAAAAAVIFGSAWLVDFFWLHRGAAAPAGAGPLDRLLAFDPDTLQSALGAIAQIIAALLAIAITVASIVVQLAATRYTPRVADMFFRDRTNLAVMGFFVVACVDAVWVSLIVTRDYVPTVTVLVTAAIATASLLILVPYFAYVFDFLDPRRVIDRIGDQTLASALATTGDAAARQTQVATSMEQLADIAVNSLAQKDKVIASAAAGALRRVVIAYFAGKPALPPASFAVSPALRENPDFVAMSPAALDDLVAARTWFEWKGLRQLGAVFSEALASLPEMAHVVSIETRHVAEAALACGDAEALALAVRFVNSDLRATLNARDVRAAYNVLNEYRLLAEAVLRAGAGAAARAAEIAGHFRYYALTAQAMGLGFVMETAAYDLCALCELASELGAPAHDALLGVFLEIDKEPETAAEEKTLRGVRKAQVKLATYYLARGMTARARRIFEDMAHESAERLRSIRAEMLAVTSRQFWEAIDRGINFDYLDDERKARLAEFFGWFPSLVAA